MRIALLTGEYPPQPGGVGDYTRQLGLGLGARGHRVAVLTIRAGRFVLYDQLRPGAADAAPDEQLVIAASNTPSRPLDWSPRCWPYVIAALGVWRPDWLHIQYQTGAYAMRAGVNMLPWRLRWLESRPLVAVTFHDLLAPYLFPKAGRLRGWVNRRLASDADALVATNAADAAQLGAIVGAGAPARPSSLARALPQRLAAGHAPAMPALIPIGSNIAVAPPPGYVRPPGGPGSAWPPASFWWPTSACSRPARVPTCCSRRWPAWATRRPGGCC